VARLPRMSAPIASTGLRERKKVALKQRLAQTTLALIRERGYDATTIEEIVRRVEVSQPTFYKYYAGKDAILVEHALSGFGPLLAGAMRGGGSVASRMRRFLLAVAQQITADRALWRAIALADAYNPIRNPELLRSNTATTRIVELAIAQGQQHGEFTQAYSPRRLASALEGMLLRACLEWGADYPASHDLGASLAESFGFFLRAARPLPLDRKPSVKGVARPRAPQRKAARR
jgi:AcrR family transcriptional regulator